MSGVSQNIWIFSDLQVETALPQTALDPTLDYTVYGYGIGRELYMDHFIEFVPDRCNALNNTEWDAVMATMQSDRGNLSWFEFN